jgi:hypothetical protein
MHEHAPGQHVHGADDHEHAGDEHQHVASHHQHGQLGHGAPVLDIGGDIGALVLYTPAELEGMEIEVSPTTAPDHRTHTEVLRRTVGGRTFWAGVYAQLPEGDYQVWYDDPSRELSFSITGGEVSELVWH